MTQTALLTLLDAAAEGLVMGPMVGADLATDAVLGAQEPVVAADLLEPIVPPVGPIVAADLLEPIIPNGPSLGADLVEPILPGRAFG